VAQGHAEAALARLDDLRPTVVVLQATTRFGAELGVALDDARAVDQRDAIA